MAVCIICEHEHDRSVTCNDAMLARSKPALAPEMLGEEDRKNIAFANLIVRAKLEKTRRIERTNGSLSDEKKALKIMCERFIAWADRLLGSADAQGGT